MNKIFWKLLKPSCDNITLLKNNSILLDFWKNNRLFKKACKINVVLLHFHILCRRNSFKISIIDVKSLIYNVKHFK